MTRALDLVAFDLMDTVVVDPFYEAVPRALGLSFERMIADKDPDAWAEFERGLIGEATFLARYFRPESGRRAPDEAQIRHALCEAYRLVDGVESLLDELRRRHPELGCWVLSNYSAWIELVWGRLGLDRFFDGRVVSCETGHRKPEPEAYRVLCLRAGVAPERCLLVDDRAANVEGARAVGMQAELFTDATALRAALKARGLLRA